jgi:hypothetical protein
VKIESQKVYDIIQHGRYWSDRTKTTINCPECLFEQEYKPNDEYVQHCGNCDCEFKLRDIPEGQRKAG